MRTLNWLMWSLVMPLVAAVRFTLQPNNWAKILRENTFQREIAVKRTSMVAFFRSSLHGDDGRPVSQYLEAVKQLHPLVSAYAVNCDDDESLCKELEIDVKNFRVSVMVYPRGTELEAEVLPEVFKSNVIVSLVKQAVPDYVVKLIDIKHIRAWPDEIYEPAVKKQGELNTLILDKMDSDKFSDEMKAGVKKDLVKENEPKYRALLLAGKITPFYWRVLANQYYGKMTFGVVLNANVDVQKQLGLKEKEKIVVFSADAKRIPYNGEIEFEVVVNFLNTILEGTSGLYEFSN